MNKGMKYWVAMAILAFASVISFFQINSYQADKHHLNGFWTIAGIILALGACFCLYKVRGMSDD